MITLEQRIARLESLLTRIMSEVKSDIRVALPAKVVSFNPSKQTVSCIPTVRELVNLNGKVSYKDLPILEDVPIIMPRAGGWVITLPIKPGDECMVVFQDLCIDGWWFRGGIQNWNDLRRHDLSDAIAIFSPWSQPNAISNYSTSEVELRSLDGSIKLSLGPLGANIKAGETNTTGNITSEGTITGEALVAKNGYSGVVTVGTQVLSFANGILISVQ